MALPITSAQNGIPCMPSPMQPETPVELVVSPSDSYDGSVYNKGSSTIENKAAWCVNRYL